MISDTISERFTRFILPLFNESSPIPWRLNYICNVKRVTLESNKVPLFPNLPAYTIPNKGCQSTSWKSKPKSFHRLVEIQTNRNWEKNWGKALDGKIFFHTSRALQQSLRTWRQDSSTLPLVLHEGSSERPLLHRSALVSRRSLEKNQRKWGTLYGPTEDQVNFHLSSGGFSELSKSIV